MLLSINSETEIIKLIKNLDKQAIAAILEKYGDCLYGIAYQKLKSESLAAKVVQQTFVTVWQQLANYDEQQHRIFNWILKIMNQIIDTTYIQKAA